MVVAQDCMQTVQERVRAYQGWQSRFLVGVCALGFWVSVADARNLRRPDTWDGRTCLFASVRGSHLVALGRDREALEAYLEAERISGGNVYQRLTTARHLLHGMDQPTQALEIVAEVLETRPKDVAVRHECRAIQGLVLLFLGQIDRAVKSLVLMCSELASRQLPCLSCNLTLVEELSRRPLAVAACERYLA